MNPRNIQTRIVAAWPGAALVATGAPRRYIRQTDNDEFTFQLLRQP
ncbi:MAG: hypothetical protein WAQ74_01040 [Kiritimatiellia bacterium]|nr:hypothetical protein [Lentisphaerota bacterium]